MVSPPMGKPTTVTGSCRTGSLPKRTGCRSFQNSSSSTVSKAAGHGISCHISIGLLGSLGTHGQQGCTKGHQLQELDVLTVHALVCLALWQLQCGMEISCKFLQGSPMSHSAPIASTLATNLLSFPRRRTLTCTTEQQAGGASAAKQQRCAQVPWNVSKRAVHHVTPAGLCEQRKMPACSGCCIPPV